MHYIDGTEARVGDVILINIGQTYPTAQRAIGVVVGITPGSTACNGSAVVFAHVYFDEDARMHVIPTAAASNWCFTVGEAALIDYKRPPLTVPLDQ